MTRASSSSGYNWQYSYDLMGRVTTQTLETAFFDPNTYYVPAKVKASYGYNNDGLLNSVMKCTST